MTLVATGGPELGGIVGLLGGTVKSCYNTGEISTICGWAYSAGIVGDFGTGSSIEDCYNTGTIKGEINYVGESCWLGVGGIGACAGGLTIKNCYNLGDVIVEKTDDWSSIGGFASELGGSNVENCYNYGNVVVKSAVDVEKGFPVGGFSGSFGYDGTLKNCYNFGNVDVNSSFENVKIGGFLGEVKGSTDDIANIENCYTIGNIKTNADKTMIKGSFIGKVENEYDKNYIVNMDNCYYLKEIGQMVGEILDNLVVENSGNKTETEMKSEDFVQLLNTGNTETIWKQDVNNKNQGFPILYFQ